jgi:predicted peptidase
MRLALALVKELCKAFPVDHNRIYATGLSMGALGMWDMVTRAPELFAAGIAICGGYDTTQASRIWHIPFWVFHGSADASVPVEGSRAMVEALKECGGSPRYTEYKGAGHPIWQRTYGNSEVISWLFQQSRNGHLNKRRTNT